MKHDRRIAMRVLWELNPEISTVAIASLLKVSRNAVAEGLRSQGISPSLRRLTRKSKSRFSPAKGYHLTDIELNDLTKRIARWRMEGRSIYKIALTCELTDVTVRHLIRTRVRKYVNEKVRRSLGLRVGNPILIKTQKKMAA